VSIAASGNAATAKAGDTPDEGGEQAWVMDCGVARSRPHWVMANLIEERVVAAREGRNPYVIARMESGWAVIGDVQPLPGYCLLLADPVVAGLNDLSEEGRTRYLLDVCRIGDALLKATDAYRINYEILGNSEPALHAHICPRYLTEPPEKRRLPAMMGYNWSASRQFDPDVDGALVARLRALLRPSG
jgi:diadenosine tetraphosphate (Ap4A) HIT family hydrolase